MNRDTKIIQKAAAISLMLIGLLSMIVAWDLLLVASIYNSTVIVLEMGGVMVCMAGYFLWRRTKAPKKEALPVNESKTKGDL
jgi:uncharacterized membrane protein YfcA